MNTSTRTDDYDPLESFIKDYPPERSAHDAACQLDQTMKDLQQANMISRLECMKLNDALLILKKKSGVHDG